MNIIHDKDDLRFYAELEGEEAELTYTYPEEGILDFDHTFVPKKARGQGLADDLVKAGLEFVKKENYKFIPSCPVVEAFVKRHPEYNHYQEEV
ncbi:GNAT family N-acetyltransferase [Pontibacter beigongshangensis]|uniref:GNAT family N-acetyltransferase n=1 Tax=Pontibacter beigongshangensis TaxID=2574733 RepID=UPI00164EE11B|nr:GNAT family N-acetyltransferase [Pontibacter beigongshangensis]